MVLNHQSSCYGSSLIRMVFTSATSGCGARLKTPFCVLVLHHLVVVDPP
jgi:hypothetical protein